MKKKPPIRIAQIIGKWFGGGVESVVMNYYRNIDRTKIQFDFICDSDSTDIPYEEIENLGGKVILISPYQKIFRYHKELKKILKDGNYKIVHSHINTLSVFSLWAAKSAGVPVRIAHSHSTTNKKEKKKNILKQILRPFSKLFATNYMCCTEYAGIWLFGEKFFDKGNVKVLNNAIDLEKFKYNEKMRKRNRKALNIKEDTLVIGHIGRFVEQKNHRFLIEIFNDFHKINKNSILLLIGQGPLEDEIKVKAKQYGIEKSVIFLGQRNDVNNLYNMMDIFVLPSLYEGLGIVLIEAQCSGLKCITSSVVPKDVCITDNIDFLGFDNKQWVNRFKKLDNKYNRIVKFNKMVGKYDIKKETVKLNKMYMEMYKSEYQKQIEKSKAKN